MSEEGDVDVESSEDVPEIGEEAVANTSNENGLIYGRVSSPPSSPTPINIYTVLYTFLTQLFSLFFKSISCSSFIVA